MDGIANVARTQQTTMTHQSTNEAQLGKKVDSIEQMRLSEQKSEELKNQGTIDFTKDDVNDLVKELNDAISPFNTSLRFGVDKEDIFYVSVIDTKSDKMLRRYPAEAAFELLPKMRDVGGLLFDSKG